MERPRDEALLACEGALVRAAISAPVIHLTCCELSECVCAGGVVLWLTGLHLGALIHLKESHRTGVRSIYETLIPFAYRWPSITRSVTYVGSSYPRSL